MSTLRENIETELRSNPRFSFRYVDRTFWFLFFALIIAAAIALFSASSTLVYKSNSNIGPVGHQMFFIFIGVVFAFVIQFLPSWVIRSAGYAGLAITVLMLYVMLLPHNPFVVTVNGASRWFKLFGVPFQPSEFAKIGLMIVVADQLSRATDEESMKKMFLRTLGITLVTVFPILVGNFSTAVLMSGVVFLLWIIAGVNWRYWASAAGIAAVVLVLGYFFVEAAYVRPNQEPPRLFKRTTVWVKRVDQFIAEKQPAAPDGKQAEENVLDDYQQTLAKVAVARGSASPLGVLPGNSKERDYLPLAYADYIFAIIVEETGIIGAFVLIFLYLAILFRACYVSARFDNPPAMYMTMGLALMLTCQALISMLVAVGVGPVTGQPLPMITMGGTSSLATALYFGIMMSVSREQNQLVGEQEEVARQSMEEMPTVEE